MPYIQSKYVHNIRRYMTPFSKPTGLPHNNDADKTLPKTYSDLKSATSPPNATQLHHATPTSLIREVYKLRFCFNILYYNSYSDLLMVKSPTRSRCMQHTVQSPPRYCSRTGDGPVIGPKHVVLSINTTPYYIGCVRLYYPCTFVCCVHIQIVCMA